MFAKPTSDAGVVGARAALKERENLKEIAADVRGMLAELEERLSPCQLLKSTSSFERNSRSSKQRRNSRLLLEELARIK